MTLPSAAEGAVSAWPPLRFLIRGLALLKVPTIRTWAIIPIALNLVVYAAIVGLAIWGFAHVERLFEAWLPHWLRWLAWLLWPVFLVLLLLLMTCTFTTVANLLASPFNGVLAERVQLHLTGQTPPGALGLDVRRAVRRQIQSMAYVLPWTIASALLFVVPGLNAAAPAVWFGLSGWMNVVQLTDYVSDNNLEPFADMLAHLRSQGRETWAYGLLVTAICTIPLVNLLVMPAAVAGATVMWLEQHARSEG